MERETGGVGNKLNRTVGFHHPNVFRFGSAGERAGSGRISGDEGTRWSRTISTEKGVSSAGRPS